MKAPDAWFYMKDKNDWTLDGASDLNIRERLKTFAVKTRFQYEDNQGQRDFTKHLCTAFAPMLVILTRVWKSREKQQRWDFFIFLRDNYGYKIGVGHYMNTGTKGAVKYWNWHHPDDSLIYFNLWWNTKDFHYALDLWYRLVIWWKFSALFQLDREDDNILNKISSRINKTYTYWHIFTVHKKSDWEIEFIDNYKGRTSNRYTVSKDELDEIARRWDGTGFYPSAYVIVSDAIISERLPSDRIKALMTLMQANSKEWHNVEEDGEITDEKRQEIQAVLHMSNNSIREILE